MGHRQHIIIWEKIPIHFVKLTRECQFHTLFLYFSFIFFSFVFYVFLYVQGKDGGSYHYIMELVLTCLCLFIDNVSSKTVNFKGDKTVSLASMGMTKPALLSF